MSNEQREFIPIPGRDAWATIRGYVYQVDITVGRWLSLQTGEELQLECGEDIDRIQRAVVDCAQEKGRLLEQIKYRENPITLNSPVALEALASFVQHRTNNPHHQISFLYVTNSKVGREYKSPFETGEPGIQVWRRIWREELSVDERDTALKGIRTILGRARKPVKVVASLWKGFHEFIVQSNDAGLLEYVKSFEWNTEAPSFSQVREEIKQNLLRSGTASSATASEALYDCLFLFVIKKLATPGTKVLTIQELTAVVSTPSIDPADEQLLSVIKSVEERLRSLEEKATQSQEYLMRMDANLSSLVSQSGFQSTVEYAVRRVPLDVPPLVDRAAMRSNTINRFVKALEEKAWCALNGEIGLGKTQFAILIVTALRARTIWIRFRNLDIGQSCLRLDAALATVSGTNPSLEFRKWYSEVFRGMHPGTMIVLDDLPRRTSGDDFDSRLLLLSEACSGNNCKLISTSNEELPPTLKERAGRVLVAEKIPLFDDEDAKELFLAYEAPPKVLNEKFVSFLRSLARGHPMLLTAIARNLISSGWRISDLQLQGLFKGNYADDLKPHIRQLLTTTVNAPKTRELLYRLNLAGSSFGNEHVRLVSEVEPQIDLPMERLADAQGLWIQRDSGSKYLVSPLLSNLGSSDLSSATEQGVHEALGLNIMSKRSLGPYDVISAFSHFSSALNHERAATVLILALGQFARLEKPVRDDWLITSILAEQPLPEQISLGARLCLRSLQVITRRKLGKDINYPLADFDSLLAIATEKDAFGVFSGGISLALNLAQENPVRANRYLLKAIKMESAVVMSDGTRPDFLSQAKPEYVLWWTGLAIHSEDDLHDWISTLEELEPSRLRMFWDTPLGEGGSVSICEKLWLRESAKPKESQNWDAILGLLVIIGDFARRTGGGLVWASSVRARIIVLAEYKKQFADALSLAIQATSDFSGDPRCLFLIQESMGRQFVYAKRWAEALEWLECALDQKVEAFPLMHMQVLLASSQAAGKADKTKATTYCERAVALAEGSDDIPEEQVVVALGEKAIAHWQAGDLLATYKSWESAVDRLFAAKSEKESWKALFGICGHVSGYFSSVASTGKPPESDFDYTVPEPGMFLRDYTQVAVLYDAKKEWLFAGQLTLFALAVGLEQDAARWALRAVEAGRGGWKEELSSSLRLYAVCQAIIDERYAEALDIAIDASVTLAIEFSKSAGGQTSIQSLPTSSSVSGNDSVRALGDYNSAFIALIPIIFRLATLWMSDPQISRESALGVANECTRIAKTSVSPDLWNKAATLLREIFSKEASWQQLNELGNEYAAKNETVLYIICFVGAMLHVRPRDALRIQLRILPTLEAQMKRYGSFQRIIVPCVLTYWQVTLDKAPHFFRMPSLLKEMIGKLAIDSTESSLKSALRKLAYPLDVPLTDSDREWLKTS